MEGDGNRQDDLTAEHYTAPQGFEHAPAVNASPALDTQRAGAATGTVVSHYRLEQLLGVGGMGEVYRAHDLALDRPAAIKVLRAGVDEGLRQRLMREAETSARLAHPSRWSFTSPMDCMKA